MAGWTDAARLKLYVKRYGEAEGRAKFEEKTGLDASSIDIPADDPMDAPQATSDMERKPRRSGGGRSRKPNRTEVLAATAVAVDLTDKGAQWLIPTWRDEHLTHEEIGALADALTDEIMSSERLLRLLVNAQKNGRHAKLAYVCAMIALPRMQRHGMIPGGMFGDGSTSDGSTVPMESGGAHGVDRDDREREVNPSSVPVEPPAVFRGAPVEGGSGEVPGGNGGAIVYGNGRSSGIPYRTHAAMGETAE